EQSLRRAGAFPYTVLFAPSWMYRSHPETGSDFAYQRRVLDRLGVPNRLIASRQDASVEDNAAAIPAAVRGATRGGGGLGGVGREGGGRGIGGGEGQQVRSGGGVSPLSCSGAGGSSAGGRVDQYRRGARGVAARRYRAAAADLVGGPLGLLAQAMGLGRHGLDGDGREP